MTAGVRGACGLSAPAGRPGPHAGPAVRSKIQRTLIGIFIWLKVGEVKGGTAPLKLSVTQKMAGGEVEVRRVLGEGDGLSRGSWQPGRKAGRTRCDVKTLRGK